MLLANILLAAFTYTLFIVTYRSNGSVRNTQRYTVTINAATRQAADASLIANDTNFHKPRVAVTIESITEQP